MSKSLKYFRKIAIAEGISYLLFAITMPLKYMLEIREPNLIVGSIHGALFVLYVIFALYHYQRYDWKISKTLIVLIASVIPFASFWAEKKYLQDDSP